MNSKVALLSLALASSTFALDEYLPLGKGVLELDAGVNPVYPEVGDAGVNIPLQAKYGVMNGMDLELGLNYAASGSATGLAQPDIAAKYSIGTSGAAVFVDLALPFATGDLDAPGTGLGITPGIVFGKNYGQIQAVAKASYQLNMKDDSFTKGNVLDVYLKPGYMVNDKLSGYVGLDYKMTGKSDPATTDGTTFTLLPGVTYTLSPTVAFEANVPIIVSNDVGGKDWGIWASVYYTIPAM